MNLLSDSWNVWSWVVCVSLLGGCGDSPASVDAGRDATADSGLGEVGGDRAVPADTSVLPDTGVALRPTVVSISTTGHDRFFGVAYNTVGDFFAVGVVADGTEATTDFRTVVAKFSPSGALDTTFGSGGFATHNITVGTSGEVARGVVVQPTGRIVVAATVEHLGATDPRDRDIALLRFNPDGSRDGTFGTDGVVTLDLSAGEVVGSGYVADSAWGLSVYPDGRLIVSGSQKRSAGTDSDFAIVRLSVDGVRDSTFGANGVATVDINNRSANPRTATVLSDGSVIGSGYMDDGGVVKPVLFKLSPTGQIDTTFGTNGIFSQPVLAAVTECYATALQGTSLVTAGYGRNAANESLDWVSLRLSANGQLDTTYGTNGLVRFDVAGFNDNARSLVVLPDNRLLLVGGGRTSEMNSDAMVAVLSPNGQPDTGFAPNGQRLYDLGGASDFFWGVAVNPSRTHAAIVGNRGVGTAPGNDDAAVLLLPLSR